MKEKILEFVNKVGKKRLALIAAFLLFVLVLIWAFLGAAIITKNFNREQLEGTENKQSLDISDIILTETKDNVKFWEIYAEKGSYDSDNKVASLRNIAGNFYRDNEVSMSFVSSKGTYDEVKKQIVTYENTRIAIKDGTVMNCDRLVWSGSDKPIVATGHIRINRDNKLISTAQKAVISSDYSKFKIVGATKTELFDSKEINKK
ncbi:MAG: LPS export ABC transporter periplasmic protein LptC [bacterium]|nr:LPS export ABC transporter periplasmic protein LptC [bacterium]